MAKNDLTPAEIRIVLGVLADPEGVATWLDEIQYEACAGLIRFPDLVKGCTAHLFDGQDGLYLDVFQAVKAGAHGLDAVYLAVSRKQRSSESAVPIAELAGYPVTRWRAASAIEQLKKFVAWQYRQEKARRKVAA